MGPTNTGKTYYAIERMLSYSSGIIGLPLRLLAREVYEKIVFKKKGPEGPFIEMKIIYKSKSALIFSTKFNSSQGKSLTVIVFVVPEASLKTFSTSLHSRPMWP